MKYILAIDQGTTGSRAVLYDRGGKPVAHHYSEIKQYFPKPGWVEQDPREIWESVRSSIEKCLDKVKGADVAAIGITNQRETTVMWDRDTGKPVYRAIVWQCRRTAGRCERIKKDAWASSMLTERTGLAIDAYFSASKAEWIIENVPNAREKVRKDKLFFGTTDSWVLWNLTGGASHATDLTNASRTMLFNIDKKEWDDDALRFFKVPRSAMPEVKPSSGIFGRTIKIGRLPAGVPIAGMAGDQQAALFGQGCFEPGSVKNTYGTGSFLLMNTGEKRPVSGRDLIVTLAAGTRGEPVYAVEGSVFVAGASIQWLRDGIKVLKNAAASEEIAVSVRDNGGVYFVPALAGLGAPYWDQEARGAIYGITRGTTSAHIVRAAIEAMCYQTRDILETMRAGSGMNIRELKVDGGASANDFLCQFQADILGINVVRPRVIESTSLGAAYLAGLAVGYWKDTQDIKKKWKADKTFRPSIGEREAATLYAGWKDAVKRTLSR